MNKTQKKRLQKVMDSAPTKHSKADKGLAEAILIGLTSIRLMGTKKEFQRDYNKAKKANKFKDIKDIHETDVLYELVEYIATGKPKPTFKKQKK